jgi:thiol-disulfide isomerase/thioredoxin
MKWLGIVIIVIVIVFVLYLIYNNRHMVINKEKFISEPVTLYYFYNNRCVYCKEFNEVIQQIKDKFAKSNVKIEEIDTTDPNTRNIVDNYKISGTPKLLLIKNNDHKFYKGNRKLDDVIAFINN